MTIGIRGQTTTELEEIRNGGRYTWGKVNEIYEIGPYSIVEYYPHKTEGGLHLEEFDTSKLAFALYVGGASTNSSWYSLDAALAAGIAYRAEGCNHRGDMYFIAAMEAFATPTA